MHVGKNCCYLCFDIECTFTSTGKQTLYVYMSDKTWMERNLRNMFTTRSSLNTLPSSVQEEEIHNSRSTGKFIDSCGIQIGATSLQGFTLFGHVHRHKIASDCLSNFFFQDWV